MSDAQRALLDQLMGKHRNLSHEDQLAKALKWSDDEVCPWFLQGFCPNDLFINTKSDLGPCGKDHDLKLREAFQKEPTRVRARMAQKFLRELRELADDADRKIARGKIRLELTAAPASDDPAAIAVTEEIKTLKENVVTLTSQMEALGEEGKVEESKTMLTLVDGLKQNIKDLEHKRLSMAGLDPGTATKQMEMCEICAAFLIVNDAESRVTAHLTGKQHLGYAKIREAIKELEAQLAAAATEAAADARDASPGRKPREDRENDRDRSRRSDRDRDRDRGRDRRNRSRERSRRSRSRDRGRRSDRDRSRDRGRRRSRSRDRRR